MSVIVRGARNTFRNSIRTVSIVLILALCMGLSMAMLMARQAVEQKIQSVKQTVGNSVSIAPAGVQGFEGGGEALTNDQLAEVAKLPNVVSVNSILNDRLTDTSLQSAIEAGSLGRRFNENRGGDGGGRFFVNGSGGTSTSFTPPILAFGTNKSDNVPNIGAVTLKSGEQINATSDENIALVGSGLAEKNSLSPGSTFTAYGQTITVKGILNTEDNRFASNIVVLPLATMQRLSGQAGAVTSATAQINSLDNTASATTAIKNALGDKADVTNEQSTADAAVAPLNSIKDVSLFALIASAGAGAVIILLTMIMIVRERKREIGVLKAIGATNTKIATQFMAEATTFTLLAAIAGIVIGVLLANPITDTLVNNARNSSEPTAVMGGHVAAIGGGPSSFRVAGLNFGGLQNINAVISWDTVVFGLLAALVIAIIGSGVATWFITKVRPSEAIRAE